MAPTVANTLNTAQRAEMAAEIQQQLSARRELCRLLKSDMLAVVSAVDTWVEESLETFTEALPARARTVLTAAQKVEILSLVCKRRWEVRDG